MMHQVTGALQWHIAQMVQGSCFSFSVLEVRSMWCLYFNSSLSLIFCPLCIGYFPVGLARMVNHI